MPNEPQLTQARTETQDRRIRPQQEGTTGPADDEASVDREASDDSVLRIPRLPAAARSLFPAARRARLGALYGIALLSALDGSLLLLANAGAFQSLGSSLAVGLTVIAGAGSWIAAQGAFAGRPKNRSDLATLVALGGLIAAGAVGSTYLAMHAGSLELRVLPRLSGWIILLVAGDLGGLPLPRVGQVPLPAATAAAGALAEGARWIPL